MKLLKETKLITKCTVVIIKVLIIIQVMYEKKTIRKYIVS